MMYLFFHLHTRANLASGLHNQELPLPRSTPSSLIPFSLVHSKTNSSEKNVSNKTKFENPPLNAHLIATSS
jgi:hypothetical protein